MTGGPSTHHDPPAFVRLLNFCFNKVGVFIADYDKWVLLISLIFTAICSVKIAFTPQEDDVRRGWSPDGARSIQEVQEYTKYIGVHSTDPLAAAIYIEANDNDNMLRIEHMYEAMKLLDFLSTNITHRNESFNTLCAPFCSINEPVRQFYNGMVMRASANSSDETSALRIDLTFPFMTVLGKELDLSPHFYGVQQKEYGKGGVDFLKVLMVTLQLSKPYSWTRDDVKAYERKVAQYLHQEFSNPLIHAYSLSLTFATDEVVRTGLTIFPFIGIGFLIMSVFSVITVYYSSSQYNQWSIHRVSMAILGCVCPLLATSTALGLLFWFGFRFGTILAVTPFLVLAIGVDDAFLQMQSWSRYYAENPNASLRERVAAMLVDVGPSITITSLTNIFAFLIGYYTPTPEIQLFCVGNAVAIFFDFVYQITIYTSIISIAGRLEMRNAERQRRVVNWNPIQNEKMVRFLDDYSQWLSSRFTAMFLFVGLCAYWFVCIQGAQQMRVVLSPKSLVISGSKLIDIEVLREEYVLPNYTTVVLLVNNAVDLHKPSRLKMATDLIESFEAYPECIGSDLSHFWLRDYQLYQEMGGEEEDESNEALKGIEEFSNVSLAGFLNWPEFRHWGGFLRFDENGKLAKFMATVSYHGENLGKFEMRKEMIWRWRATVDNFTELEASIFDDFAAFVDQTETILPATVWSSICTLACMIVVCFLFMYNIFTVTVASLSICSICLGVFGLLALWSINLDPISMSCIIMSIGFSVDFPAHITYHYFREGIEEPESPPSRRIARSLLAIGFPLLQCGLSTILFVLCLLFVPTYMGEVFVKTMVLVVSLGLIHGLVIVPAFLCALTNIYECCLNKRGNGTSKVSTASSQSKILKLGVSPSSSEGKISSKESPSPVTP